MLHSAPDNDLSDLLTLGVTQRRRNDMMNVYNMMSSVLELHRCYHGSIKVASSSPAIPSLQFFRPKTIQSGFYELYAFFA